MSKLNEKERVKNLISTYKRISELSMTTPTILDFHPVMNACNLSCFWCIGKVNEQYKTKMMSIDEFYMCMDKIFDDKYKVYWPKEIHICGNNSEPLLNKELVLESLPFFEEKNCKIVMVSNGILIDDELVESLEKLHTLNISLDAVNDEKYFMSKCLKGEYETPYTQILNNIKNVRRVNKQGKLVISCSFVIVDINVFDKEFESCIAALSDAGVDMVKVRFEAKSDFVQYYDFIREKVNRYNEKYSDINIICNFPSECEGKDEFNKCFGPFLWPTLASNMKLYPCAHSANMKFREFLDLSKDYYYDFYLNENVWDCEKNKVSNVGCNRICPPLIGTMNNEKAIVRLMQENT